MQTLIDDVLVYSKVDLKGIEWELTEVETALNQALGNLRGRITETQAAISYDSMPTIVADSTQLMQLFQNLLGNAIKFKKKDEVPPDSCGSATTGRCLVILGSGQWDWV
jgi:chemotaxis family two-component system sensor kinase Cph1